MKIIYNDKLLDILGIFFPFKVGGVAIYPCIMLREDYKTKYRHKAFIIINHESIHIKQQKELLVVFFALWYGIEYLAKIVQYRDLNEAYKNISFEKEAYANENDLTYLSTRKIFSFLLYL